MNLRWLGHVERPDEKKYRQADTRRGIFNSEYTQLFPSAADTAVIGVLMRAAAQHYKLQQCKRYYQYRSVYSSAVFQYYATFLIYYLSCAKKHYNF